MMKSTSAVTVNQRCSYMVLYEHLVTVANNIHDHISNNTYLNMQVKNNLSICISLYGGYGSGFVS